MSGGNMNSRQRVRATFEHRQADRVPRWASLTPDVLHCFQQQTAAESPADYWGWDLRDVRFRPPNPLPDLRARFARYLQHVECEWILDWEHADFSPEWGVATRPAHLYHLSAPISPMARFTSLDDLRAYPFPDYTGEWRHDHLEARIDELHRAGYPVNGHLGWIFQTAWTLRSEVQLFEDFFDRPRFAATLLDRITEVRVAQAERFARAGVDMVAMNDDIGGQNAMILSPKMWRRWLKPRLAAVISAAHRANPGVHFRYHSDGYYEPVIPDLIEIGVASLITVQQESMDARRIKERFGRDLVLEGTLGLQGELMHGAPADVERLVRGQCGDLKPGGGWVASPGNGVTPDVPWANLAMIFEALDRYGNYGDRVPAGGSS